MPDVAILAQGTMGAGVARRLGENGVRVLTCLEGRSESSRRRAEQAGMQDVAFSALAQVDLFLSILPPGEALALAQRAAAEWGGREKVPVYVDCNAVNPSTVERIAGVLNPAGIDLVDAGIIGGPPSAGKSGPRFYASGAEAPGLAALRDFGLDIEILDAPIGAASALKMSYAGITKGMTAIGAIMCLAATRAGAGAALKHELAASNPTLSGWLRGQCVGMIPKAYRWVSEMEEIAAFQGEDQAGAQLYQAIARFYERLAADAEDGKEETDRLRDFFGSPG